MHSHNMYKTVVIINGRPTSGKDTFCSLAIGHFGSDLIESISSVDKIKDIATQLGWDGQKDSKSRKFLSDLKDLSTEYNDGPFNQVKAYVNESSKSIIFVHVREVSEIDKLKKSYQLEGSEANCYTLKLNRNVESVQNNTGDLGADADYEYDYEIFNWAGLEELEDEAISFIRKLMDDSISVEDSDK